MPRVLIAEDNKINQVVAAGSLKKLGYDVEIVDGGADAIIACLHTTFDAVLMDVMMPGVDGYQATGVIRENEAKGGLPHVPIIGLSARAMEGDREIALDAGMDDYLTKPLRTPALEAALARWVPTAIDAEAPAPA